MKKPVSLVITNWHGSGCSELVLYFQFHFCWQNSLRWKMSCYRCENWVSFHRLQAKQKASQLLENLGMQTTSTNCPASFPAGNGKSRRLPALANDPVLILPMNLQGAF